MDRIPLINPNLVNRVSAKADNTAVVILKAEVVSSDPIGPQSKHSQDKPSQTQEPKQNAPQEKPISQNSEVKEQQYRVVLKISEQTIETVSKENFKKGALLDVKVSPGPELKILPSTLEKPLDQTSAKAAMQQLLTDRIPKIQSTEFSKLIDQLSKLMAGTAAPPKATNGDASGLTNKTLAGLTSHTDLTAPTTGLTTKQALAQLAYQSLNPALKFEHGPTSNPDTPLFAKSGHFSAQTTTSNSNAMNNSLEQSIKNWLQQLPNSQDISTVEGLKNALNNTGIKAEAQLSQLAQQLTQLTPLGKTSHGGSENIHTGLKKSLSANSIFQQLQKIQQKIFSNTDSSSSSTNVKDLASALQTTTKSLEQSSKVLSELTSTNSEASTSRWQNPLLSSQAYASLGDLLKDPLLQNPSSNNKIALSQILSQLTPQDDSPIRIPLNWTARSSNEITVFRTLQNLLAHLEREQGIQMQQVDNAASNNLNQTHTNSQQWLPLLFNHHEQFQLIEFFINQEEKSNNQGEKNKHWLINLHVELPQLGLLGIEISMFENECSTTFWSESASTLSQISLHVQPLRQRLTEQGIIVNDVQSRHGTLAKRKQNFEQRLVDIKT